MPIKKIPTDTKYYHFYNANPKDKKTGDCVIRALSVAFNKDWDTILDELVGYAHRYKQMVDSDELYIKYIKNNGYTTEKQPRYENGTKYTGEEFCDLLNYRGLNYPVLAHIGSHHITVFVNGRDDTYRVNDTWNCSRDKVGKVYIDKRDIQAYYS